MKIRVVLLILPVILVSSAGAALGQSSLVSNAATGAESLKGAVVYKNADAALFLPDSLTAPIENSWDKKPGQMPIFIHGLLPNSMSIIVPPKIDDEMIVPVIRAVRDSTAADQ